MASLPASSKTLARKILFTAKRFAQHELANHAAAGACAFLLSAVLLVLGFASALVGGHPEALAIVLLYLAFAWILQLFIDAAGYSLLYGVFGRLIILLVNVYAFFSLHFHGAEHSYVTEHFDALLFTRFWRVSKAPVVSRIEESLFIAPDRLLRACARAYPAGPAVFLAGEEGRTATTSMTERSRSSSAERTAPGGGRAPAQGPPRRTGRRRKALR